LEKLSQAPRKELIFMESKGSADETPIGDECDALHYHGYRGIEQATVARITNWIKQN